MAVEPEPDTVATAFYNEHKSITRIELGVLSNNDAKTEEWYYKYLNQADLAELIAIYEAHCLTGKSSQVEK